MAVAAITAAAGKLQSSRIAFDLRSSRRVHDTEECSWKWVLRVHTA